MAFSALFFVLRPGMGNENLGPWRPMVICELAAALGTRRLRGGSTLRQTATQQVQDGWAIGLIQALFRGQRLSKDPCRFNCIRRRRRRARDVVLVLARSLWWVGTCESSAVWFVERVRGGLEVRERWTSMASRWQKCGHWWSNGRGSWKGSSPRMPVPESVVCLAVWPVISRVSEAAVV